MGRTRWGALNLGHRSLRAVLHVLTIFLVVGFIGINIAIPLPAFLVAENALVAFLLALGLIASVKREEVGLAMLVVVSLIYSGRMSRSVVSPTGSLLPLWEAHLPVMILLLILGMLCLAMLVKRHR